MNEEGNEEKQRRTRLTSSEQSGRILLILLILERYGVQSVLWDSASTVLSPDVPG